jgi:ABC-type multidrug transport system fused ATPase/permease subunit
MREAALSLGIPQWKVIVQVLYRSASAGIVTGILLALARISGETAPLLFTAFGNQYWNNNIFQPMASVPVVMNQFAGSPYESWQVLAWAGALVLTVFVLLVSLPPAASCCATVSPMTDLSVDNAMNDLSNAVPMQRIAVPSSQSLHTPSPVKLARGLDFYYDKFHALKGINLEIPEKRVTALIGPSGCGKSTCCASSTASTRCTRSWKRAAKCCWTARTSCRRSTR